MGGATVSLSRPPPLALARLSRRLGGLRQHLATGTCAMPSAGAAAAPGSQPHRGQKKGGADATAGDSHRQQRSDLAADVPPTPLELYQFDLNGVRARHSLPRPPAFLPCAKALALAPRQL
jgi:hypothetical protein